MTDAVQDFLEGSESYPAFKFENVGDAIAGIIVGSPRVLTVDKLGTTTGEKVDKLLVNLQTNPNDPASILSVWVNRGNQGRAIQEAIRNAGASSLEAGGKLMVTFTGVGQAKQAGFNPPKLYEARYKAPDRPAAAAASFFDGDGQAQAQPQAAPPATQPPPAQGSQPQAAGSWED